MPFSPLSSSAYEEAASALISACQQGNTTTVQTLVSQFPDAVRFPDNNGWTSLHHACASGAPLEIVRALVQADPSVLAAKSVPEGRSVLHCAAASFTAKIDVVNFLLQQRNSLALELDAQGRSALHWVCQGSSTTTGAQGKSHPPLDVVRKIYEAWNDAIYLVDQKGQLPIHLAFLTDAPGSQIRYLAALDPSSVSTPLPNGRLLVHCMATELMEGNKNASVGVLESLIQADPATLYVQDPFTGKTIRETAKDPLFRKLDSGARLSQIIDSHENQGGLSKPRASKDEKSSKTLDEKMKSSSISDMKMKSLSSSSSMVKYSTEQMANELVLACSQPSSSPEQARLILSACPEAVKVRDPEGFLPLHWACYHGAAVEIVRMVIEAWPESVNLTISQDRLPLHLACRQSASVDRIRLLVDKYPGSVEKPTSQDMLPIHYACRDAAPLNVVEFLVDQAPMTLSMATKSGLLPIHLSCKHGKSPETVQALVEKWPGCLREPSNDKLLPIHYLCRAGSFAPIDWMIEQDPQLLEMPDGDGNLPLHLLCKNPKSTVEAVKIVLDVFPEAASQPNAKGLTPADIAFEINKEIANYLEGALLSKRRKTGGKHPLHQACTDPRVTAQMVKDILTESPDEVCVPDEERMLPVHVACRSGASLEVIQCLVEDWPASLRWTNKGGSLPLHTACSNKASAAVVQYLITSWPKATGVANSYGWLPLHCACAYGASPEVIGILVRSNEKSSSMATYGQGDYPLHLACSGSPSLEVIFWLNEALEEGTKLANTAGELALHKACFNNAPLEVVQFLLEQYPPSLSVADRHGLTPQKVAELRKSYVVAEWLKSKEV